MQETISSTAVENLSSLFSAVSRMERESPDLSEQVRVVFLRNITIEGIEPFLKYYLYASGVRPAIAFGGYGTMAQDVLGADALVPRTVPDLIVLSLMLEELTGRARQAGAAIRFSRSWRACSTPWRRIRAPPSPSTRPWSSLSRARPAIARRIRPGGASYQAQSVHHPASRAGAALLSAGLGCYLRLLGRDASFDYRFGTLLESAVQNRFLESIRPGLRGSRVLKDAPRNACPDCDNTLWGGVIGEDGIDGIKLIATTILARLTMIF
jgi:hypothetical protein